MKCFKLSFMMLALYCSVTAYSQTTNYQVYALFVVNIAKYSSFPNVSSDLQVTVYGKSKVYDELMKQSGKNVNGHSLKVTQAEDITDLGQAQIKPIMIICEREGLHKKGAGFSFIVTENSTLRFDINNTELEKRQIKISKNLSTLANSTI